MAQWGNQGGYPPEDEYPPGGGYHDWQQGYTGADDQILNPDDPRSSQHDITAYSNLPPPDDDSYDEPGGNYTTDMLHNPDSQATLVASPAFVPSYPVAQPYPVAPSYPVVENPKDKGKGQGKDKKKNPAGDKKGTDKKGTDKKGTDKKGTDKKGKKAATAAELEIHSQDFGGPSGSFEGPGTQTQTPFGHEAYGLSNLDGYGQANYDPDSLDDAATLAQVMQDSLTLQHMNPQGYLGEPSGSGAYVTEEVFDQDQSDDTVSNLESQYGSKTYSSTKSSHPSANNDFRVHNSRDWKFGHMLIMWWTEPKGTNIAKDSTWSNKQKTQDNAHWEGWRRFIIVSKKNSAGNSKCVPVTTYQGRGVKPNAKPEHHGIVYDALSKPIRAHKEPSLGYSPVAVDMFEEYNTLSETSRVNYNKIQTLEHHYSCCFLGKVSKEDEEQFKKHAKRALDA